MNIKNLSIGGKQLTKQRFCHSIILNAGLSVDFMLILSETSGAEGGFFGMEKHFSAYRKNIF